MELGWRASLHGQNDDDKAESLQDIVVYVQTLDSGRCVEGVCGGGVRWRIVA